MKRINFITLFSILISFKTIGQTINKSVEIKGKFENSSNKKIHITSEGFNDSLVTDKQGNFHYKTTKITQPIQAYIGIGKSISFNSYLAPGYSLTITADANSSESFFNSLHLSGIGSKTNQYWKQLYFLFKNQLIAPLTDKWYDIKLTSFAQDGLGNPNLDSFTIQIKKTIFANTNKEPFVEVFKKYSIFDIKFRKLFYLFAYSAWNDLSVEQTDTLIKKSIDPNLFSTLSFDNYLDNFFYRETISYFYLDYLVNKEIVNNKEILQSRIKRKLEIANKLYSGKTKDYVLNRIIKSGISETFSFQELNMLKSFIHKINDNSSRTQLLNEYVNRKNIISKVSFGKEAPVFNLPDTSGKKHSLQDFKGKVVYIDLWASWCGPCKEEMPALKEIYDEYNKDGNLQIISIAVKDADGKGRRNQFINQHQLNWLQLEDQEDFVWNKYKITSIPRYILIDKEGKILSFDAPRPSEKDKLKKALDEAITN